MTQSLHPNQVKGFFVALIESPSPTDVLAGRSEVRALGAVLDMIGVAHVEFVAVNRQTFEFALSTLVPKAHERLALRPIVHFSAHGDRTGLRLTSGEIQTWETLAPLLRPLNERANGALVVVVSSCEGLRGALKFMAHSLNPEPAACGTVLGTGDQVPWSDTLVGYSAFYHVFHKTGDLGIASLAMKAAAHNPSLSAVVESK